MTAAFVDPAASMTASDVVDTVLQQRGAIGWIAVGKARPALVEHDQPRERCKPPEESGQRGVLPGMLQVGDEARRRTRSSCESPRT